MNLTDTQKLPVSYDDVVAAARLIKGVAHRTPVLTSRTVDALTGAEVFFKCENLQRMGAFKFRGAFNALSHLSAVEKRRGVVAYSSGNHAQAVALAGRLLNVPVVIVMPHDAPAVKLEATRGYGAEVIVYSGDKDDREAISNGLAATRGLTMIPPFDHPHVIAGQGTAAKELIDDLGPLDYLLVPCGGGGLISGCAIAANHLSPGIRVTGVEPAAGDDVTRSFQSRILQTVHNPDTIADGARTSSAGKLTFPLILHHVHSMLTVTDTELLRAMYYLWERMKIVVEPTGALAAAALLEGKIDARGKRVGIIISGGNVDVRNLAALGAPPAAY
ncbi:MAG: threo-3-hydroxy-L-aspartate ammonia-lyase [Betaproteobacteria bacterium]|nr:threo-3-hydroxy-L-aspartate ammonia-lyase [Betaproteobacteria bacterium]